MNEELRKQMKDAVNQAIDLDALSVPDALMIVRICREAVGDKIATLTEDYLVQSLDGSGGETGA